jgi:integrase/recombinase XerD
MWLHGKSQKTQEAYRADMQRFYKHVGKSLQQVTLEDLQSFANRLVSQKPTSKASMIASVKSALSFGVKSGYLKVNVGAIVK